MGNHANSMEKVIGADERERITEIDYICLSIETTAIHLVDFGSTLASKGNVTNARGSCQPQGFAIDFDRSLAIHIDL